MFTSQVIKILNDVVNFRTYDIFGVIFGGYGNISHSVMECLKKDRYEKFE